MHRYKLKITFKDKPEIVRLRNCVSWRGASQWMRNQVAKYPDWQGYKLTDLALLSEAERSAIKETP